MELAALPFEKTLHDTLSEAFQAMMRALHRSGKTGASPEMLQTKPVQRFINAHADVLDNAFQQVEMSEAMREDLRRYDYIFSGIKTFHELKETFPSIVDDNGNRKPFETFLKDVQKVNNRYNRNYLRAEYNFVNASARMAAKWEQFAKDGDAYNLQYRTAGDNRVRPPHAALNRITLPFSSPFWQQFFPPNGWNCRCNVVQVLKHKYPVTPLSEAMQRAQMALADDKKQMFRFNPGITRQTFPDYNPYTITKCNSCPIAKGKGTQNLAKNIPDNELCAACKIVRVIKAKQVEKINRNRKIYEELKENPEYENVHFNPDNGGVMATHKEHNFDKTKGWYETNVQNVGFSLGHSVILGKEPQNIFKHRSTEGLWDELPFEIGAAETGTGNNILRALKHCASKPDCKIAVLFFPNENFDTETFSKSLARFQGLKGTSQFREFKLIYCIDRNKILQIKKPSD